MAAQQTLQAASWLPGKRYVVQELITRTPGSAIWLGWDNDLCRAVALKCLAPTFAYDLLACQRFEQEAVLGAKVDSPHVVTTYQFIRAPDDLMIVMDLVDGATPFRSNQQVGIVSLETVLHMSVRLAQALEATEAAGVVHCDVKPANVLIDSSQNSLLADFGISQQPGLNPFKCKGEILCTAEYASPEQIQNAELDGRTDIYSACVTIYEWLTGARLFVGENRKQVFAQHLFKAPPVPSELRPDIPSEIDEILQMGLRKDPRDRIQTAAELRKLLEGVTL